MRVLLAVDGSEEAQDAARSLSSLAPLQSVTVLHVLDIPTWTYPTIVPEIESGLFTTLEQERQEDGEHLIEQIQSLLPVTAQTVATRIEKGKAAEVILAVALQEQSDFSARTVRLNRHGQSGIELDQGACARECVPQRDHTLSLPAIDHQSTDARTSSYYYRSKQHGGC
jgi:hypothetical protein